MPEPRLQIVGRPLMWRSRLSEVIDGISIAVGLTSIHEHQLK